MKAVLNSLASPGGGILVLLLIFGVSVVLIFKENYVAGAELMGTSVAALLYLILHK